MKTTRKKRERKKHRQKGRDKKTNTNTKSKDKAKERGKVKHKDESKGKDKDKGRGKTETRQTQRFTSNPSLNRQQNCVEANTGTIACSRLCNKTRMGVLKLSSPFLCCLVNVFVSTM
jgi:hypothetical protein